MKGIFRKLSSKAFSFLPALAIMLAVSSVESFCFFWTHQPDVPEELKN